LRLEAALPSAVLGPVDLDALRRFDSACFALVIMFSERTKPVF